MVKNKAGFTLIELLVTATITALFFGMSLAQHNSFTEQKKLAAESQKITDVLELARKKALSSDTSTPCSGEFLGFSIDVNPSNYELKSRCTLTSTLIKRYDISAGTTIDNAPQTINFQTLSAATNQGCIAVKNTSSNSCYSVRVNQAGIFNTDKCTSCGTCCSNIPTSTPTPPTATATPTGGVRPPTVATLSSSPNPSSVGQSVTFTLTIPSDCTYGTVTIYSYQVGYLGTTDVSNGTATLVVSTLTEGSHTVGAVYYGNTVCTAAVAPNITHVVGAAAAAATPTTPPSLPTATPTLLPSAGPTSSIPSPTPTSPAAATITVSSSPNPSIYGTNSITFSSTITGTGCTPEGQIRFLDGSTIFGAGAISGGVATYTTTATQLAVGTHSITAQFVPGGGTCPTVTSAARNHIVSASANPTATPAPTPLTPSSPVGSCGTYNTSSNTIPVSWSWFPGNSTTHLQVQDATSYWWYNNWVTSSPQTISSLNNAGAVPGIPNGRAVSARVSADGSNWSDWSTVTCSYTPTAPTPTPTTSTNPTVECYNYCQSIGKTGQSACLSSSVCTQIAGQNVGTRICDGGSICCCR